jgi:hypothetical protein
LTCTYLAKRLRELSSTKTGSYPHEFLCRTDCSACADYQPWYMNISRYANIDKFVNIRYIFLLARRAYSWLFQLAQMWKLLAPGVGLGDLLTPGSYCKQLASNVKLATGKYKIISRQLDSFEVLFSRPAEVSVAMGGRATVNFCPWWS